MNEDGFEMFEYLIDTKEALELMPSQFEIFEGLFFCCISSLEQCLLLEEKSELEWSDVHRSIEVDSVELRDFLGRKISSGNTEKESLVLSSIFFGLNFTDHDSCRRVVRFFEDQIFEVIFNLENNSLTIKFTDKLFTRDDGDDQRVLNDEPFYTCLQINLFFNSQEALQSIYSFVRHILSAYLEPHKRSAFEGGFRKRVYGLDNNTHQAGTILEEEEEEFRIHEREISDEIFVQSSDSIRSVELDEDCIEIQASSPGAVNDTPFSQSHDDLSLGSEPSSLEKSDKKDLEFVPTFLETPGSQECLETLTRTYGKYEANLLPEVVQLVCCARQFLEKVVGFNVQQNVSDQSSSIYDLAMELVTIILNNRKLKDTNLKNLRTYINDLVALVFDHPNFRIEEGDKDEWKYVLEMLDKYTKSDHEVRIKKIGTKERVRTQMEDELKNLELIVKKDDVFPKQKISRKKKQMKKNDFVLLRRKKDYVKKKKRRSSKEDIMIMDTDVTRHQQQQNEEINVPQRKKNFWEKVFSPIASCFVGTPSQ